MRPALTLIAVALLTQLIAPGSSINVGLVPATGEPCIAITQSRLEPGSIVTLVQPDRPQLMVTAKIGEALTSCPGLQSAMIEGPYYRLGQFSTTPKPQTVWVVVRGNVSSRPARDGSISLRLNATYPDIQVRSCTSREGLHLTVWSGQPLESRRLWHQYYYLGYDVEPSCTDADTR